MKKRAGILFASSMLLLTAVTSACSSNNENESSSSNAPESPSATATASASASSGPVDPLGKYDPPIDVSTVRILSNSVKFKGEETIDNNVWYQEYEKKLGIKLKNEWSVVGDEPGGQGEQKMNVSIASGSLPDIVPLNASQLKQLADAGKLADLTEVYEKYASPMTKQILTSSGPTALESAKFDGKLLAIPAVNSVYNGTPLLWIRTDWMKKLNLEAPKTMDDVYAIMDAFVNQDPDGNGKKDTYGIALNKDLYGFFGAVEGFFNSYHAYPRFGGTGNWIEDGSGNLAFGSIQPEVKTALGKLQELYKKGYIDREFGVKDWAKEKELIVSGKIGLFYGAMSAPIVMNEIKTTDPNADWKAFPLASADGQPAKPEVVGIALGNPQYLAVTKNAKNPEALMKLINLFFEISYGKSYSQEEHDKLGTSPTDGVERWMYSIYTGEPEKNLATHRLIKEIVAGTKSESDVSSEQMGAYRSVMKARNGEKLEPIDWALDRVFGPENSAFQVVDQYVNDNMLQPNAYTSVSTSTMLKRDATLQKLELETFSKIIMGDPLDNFDKFVDNWKKLGGDEMTKEVNEWKKSR
ncbi:putative aldouronate transport system substrate-binding protein [Cohnella sp. OV330]|uniref:extracellular solute-binding protein n=1 Tax=Cohnella sp. OV330 TaxID=1855288 RepID=UPI0008E9E9E3|nr:extracellular solute-binding protein [Cohnella sp. OV330]SFB58377.1 putative aldouronate transport system substrate-binding protein [Cohnella sp. OV330]